MIYYCDDLPHPTREHEAFIEKGVERLLEILSISNGKALVLFTAKTDMEEVYSILSQKNLPYKILMQQPRSDSVDLPWSMWAMMLKFRIFDWSVKVFTSLFACLGRGYSEAEYDGYQRYSVYVPVSDGTKLAVDYCIPTQNGVEAGEALPVVFTYTPYGRQRADCVTSAEWFTSYGYAFVSADCRGMGASYGTRDAANSPQEAQDGADIVAWIKDQNWCDGKLGTIGSSYVGQTQLAILSKSQLVDASVIGCTDYNKYDGWIRGGIPPVRYPIILQIRFFQ